MSDLRVNLIGALLICPQCGMSLEVSFDGATHWMYHPRTLISCPYSGKTYEPPSFHLKQKIEEPKSD